MKLKQLVALSVAAGFLAQPVLADKDKNKGQQRDNAVKEYRVKKTDKVRHEDAGHDDRHHDDVDARDHERHHDDDNHDDAYQGQKKQKALPPGLQKKVQRGGELPPGWEKKVQAGEVLDPEVYARRKVLKPVGKDGNELIQVEDRVYKVYQKTRQVREIVDVLKTPVE